MITVAWNNNIMANMEGTLVKDREMDETTIPFAVEVEVPSSLSVPFEKQQQQQQQSTQYHHYYQQKQQTNWSNNNSSNNQPKFTVFGKQLTLPSSSSLASIQQQKHYSNPPPYPYFQKGQEQQQQQHLRMLTLPRRVQQIQESQQSLPSSSPSLAIMSFPTSKKGKRSKKESPFIESEPKKIKIESPFIMSEPKIIKRELSFIESASKRIKQEPPSPSYSPVLPLLSQRIFDGKQREEMYGQESLSASPPLKVCKYLKSLPINKMKIERNYDIDQVDNHTQSSGSCSDSSSTYSNFSNLENISHINLNNATKIKSNSSDSNNNSSILTEKSPVKNEKWGKFFLGKPRKKYIGKKHIRKSQFCIDGETPEENLAHVIVKLEFQKGGIFYDRRKEVYSLIHKQYKKAIITDNNTSDHDNNNNIQDDDDDGDEDGSRYNNKSTNNVLRMRFTSEYATTTKRAKEHEYLDLLNLPDFKEFESNSQLWTVIDQLFGTTDTEITCKQDH